VPIEDQEDILMLLNEFSRSSGEERQAIYKDLLDQYRELKSIESVKVTFPAFEPKK